MSRWWLCSNGTETGVYEGTNLRRRAVGADDVVNNIFISSWEMALITRPFGSGIFDGNNLEQIETHPDSLILQRAQRHLLQSISSLATLSHYPGMELPTSIESFIFLYKRIRENTLRVQRDRMRVVPFWQVGPGIHRKSGHCEFVRIRRPWQDFRHYGENSRVHTRMRLARSRFRRSDVWRAGRWEDIEVEIVFGLT